MCLGSGELAAADGDDIGAVAVGFVWADAADGEEFLNGPRVGCDYVLEGRVSEDDEGGFAGLCGFGIPPRSEILFESLLCGC